MKKLLFALLTLAFAATAQAASVQSTTLFNNLSTTGTSSAVRGVGNIKTVIAQGYNNAKAEASMLGTFVLQCGPTSAGPWVSAKDQAANAISTTANASYNLDNACTWLRGSWTKGGTGNVKAWLLQYP